MKFLATAPALLGVLTLANCKGSSPALPLAPNYGADVPAQSSSEQHVPFAEQADHKVNGPIIIMANPSGSWQLYSIQPNGKDLRQITHMLTTTFTSWFPVVSGNRIAFTYGDGSGPTDIYTINIDGKGLKRETHDGVSSSPAWSPDGSRLVYSTINVKAGRQPYLVTSPVDHLGHKHTVTSDLYGSFYGEYTPDGQSIVYETQDLGVEGTWIMNADGTDKRSLTPPLGVFCPYSVSPDGRRVLLNDYCGDNNTGQTVWVMNLDDQKLTQLTRSRAGSLDEAPTYSPDGKKIAFGSNRVHPNHIDLFTMNADGTDVVLIKSGLTVGECPRIGGVPGSGNCVTPSWAAAQ